jgi:hypothetical protein
MTAGTALAGTQEKGLHIPCLHLGREQQSHPQPKSIRAEGEQLDRVSRPVLVFEGDQELEATTYHDSITLIVTIVNQGTPLGAFESAGLLVFVVEQRCHVYK